MVNASQRKKVGEARKCVVGDGSQAIKLQIPWSRNGQSIRIIDNKHITHTHDTRNTHKVLSAGSLPNALLAIVAMLLLFSDLERNLKKGGEKKAKESQKILVEGKRNENECLLHT